MGYRVEIEYDPERMEENKRRMEARDRFEYIDRVSVMALISPRFPLHVRGVGYLEYFRDPETQLYHQLQNIKWCIENIPDDQVISTEIEIEPDFEYSINTAVAFGAEVQWWDHMPPQTYPLITSVEDIDKIDIPAPTDNLWGKMLEWRQEMIALLKDIDVVFNGEKVEVKVNLRGAESPFTSAVEMAKDSFYLWLYDYPEACHKLLEKIAAAVLAWERYRRKVTGLPMQDMNTDTDSAGVLSPEMFRKFVVPYVREFYNAFPGERGMHICGDSNHLLDIYADELEITSFDGFGHMVDLEKLAEKMGGKVRLLGNVDPVLIYGGTEEEIRKAAMRCLEILAPCGGYVLCDGANLPPGTPLENIEILVEESKEYGLPELRH